MTTCFKNIFICHKRNSICIRQLLPIPSHFQPPGVINVSYIWIYIFQTIYKNIIVSLVAIYWLLLSPLTGMWHSRCHILLLQALFPVPKERGTQNPASPAGPMQHPADMNSRCSFLHPQKRGLRVVAVMWWLGWTEMCLRTPFFRVSGMFLWRI